MDNIFMNSKNSWTSVTHRQSSILQIKLHLPYMDKYRKIIQKNEFKISPSARNEEFELLDDSYSILDIQYYF